MTSEEYKKFLKASETFFSQMNNSINDLGNSYRMLLAKMAEIFQDDIKDDIQSLMDQIERSDPNAKGKKETDA